MRNDEKSRRYLKDLQRRILLLFGDAGGTVFHALILRLNYETRKPLFLLGQGSVSNPFPLETKAKARRGLGTPKNTCNGTREGAG